MPPRPGSSEIRDDFPVLRRRINNKPIIYFDSACTSLRPRQVLAAMNDFYENCSACAERSTHSLGDEATNRYEAARETVAKFINARKASEVIFTKNTTEGINLVANSLELGRGSVVVGSDREHNSNLLPWQILSRKAGVEHRVVPSNEDGTFNLERFEKSLDKSVKLVSMVYTSNLDGYTLPAEKIVKLAHGNGSLVMLDAAQFAAHSKIDVRSLGVDLLAFSGHKMLGPTGTGVLYGRYDLLESMEPFIVGGGTVEFSTYTEHVMRKPPEKFEAGVQNYAGSIGLAEATRYLDRVGMRAIERNDTELNAFVSREISAIDGVHILGPQPPELRGGIVSFTVRGMDSRDVALMMNDMSNVMIRSGQHCVHSWFKSHDMNGSARASFHLYNNEEEAQVFVDTLKKVARMAR
jgi:cysteine desulfurase/selenocysteine lyase